MLPLRKNSKRHPKTTVSDDKKNTPLILGGLFTTVGLALLISLLLGVKWTDDNGKENGWLVILIGFISVALSLWIIYNNKKTDSANISKSKVPQKETIQSLNNAQELKPKMGGAKGRFYSSAIFALIWNGVVWVIMLKNEQDAGWFIWLFVTIGILSIGAAIWDGLAMLNPKISITLHNTPLTLGNQFTVNWRVDGKRERLDRLSISLIGQEQATYQRGTDTYTDTSDFYYVSERISLSNLRMGRGELHFEIPENTMHTWQSSNNQIVWLLQVEGDIPRWPDIQNDYEITVFAKHNV